MELTETDALRAFARMWNTLDEAHLLPLLADDFHYASQWVFAEMTSAREYEEYITAKLETVRTAGIPVWAEIGDLSDTTYPAGPCVLMAQGDRDDLDVTVLLKVRDGRIARIDMCQVPPPQAARRTGEYPSLTIPEGS